MHPRTAEGERKKKKRRANNMVFPNDLIRAIVDWRMASYGDHFVLFLTPPPHPQKSSREGRIF